MDEDGGNALVKTQENLARLIAEPTLLFPLRAARVTSIQLPNSPVEFLGL